MWVFAHGLVWIPVSVCRCAHAQTYAHMASQRSISSLRSRPHLCFPKSEVYRVSASQDCIVTGRIKSPGSASPSRGSLLLPSDPGSQHYSRLHRNNSETEDNRKEHNATMHIAPKKLHTYTPNFVYPVMSICCNCSLNYVPWGIFFFLF